MGLNWDFFHFHEIQCRNDFNFLIGRVYTLKGREFEVKKMSTHKSGKEGWNVGCLIVHGIYLNENEKSKYSIMKFCSEIDVNFDMRKYYSPKYNFNLFHREFLLDEFLTANNNFNKFSGWSEFKDITLLPGVYYYFEQMGVFKEIIKIYLEKGCFDKEMLFERTFSNHNENETSVLDTFSYEGLMQLCKVIDKLGNKQIS